MIATSVAFSASRTDPRAVDGSGSGTVIEPLLALEREDLTGALEFRAHGVVTVVFVRAGEVGYASGGTIGETLGRMLVRTGRLDEDHGISVVHHMIDQLVEREEARFGEILVDHGFLTANELEIALAQQVREKLIGCILRGRGDWVFHADDPRLEAVGSYVVGVRPTLMEAARRFSERRIEDILALATPRYPEIVAPSSVVAAEFELSPEEVALLRDLDGTGSISFLRSKTAAHELLPFLTALVLGGGITMRVTPTASRRPSESRPIPPAFRTQRRAKVGLPEHGGQASQAEHDDSTVALDAPAPGMPMPRFPESASTIAVVKPALERRSLRESFDQILPDAAERAKAAFALLKVKLDGRKPKSGRRRWPDAKNDRERRLMAASAFHKGRIYLRNEEAERALPGLHRALELRPQEPEYELYVKWAQMLVNDAFKDDARRNEVEHLAIKTVKADHLCELGWSVLGHIAHHDRREEAALRFFQRAVKLDPKLIDAARLVGLLANRQSSEPHIRASIADATERARRGALQTPLDELVPVRVIREKRSDRALPKPPPRPGRLQSGQHTPRGGLVVGQSLVDSLAPVEPAHASPAAVPPFQAKRASLPAPPTSTPSPTSERTLAIAPTQRGSLTPPPQRTPSIGAAPASVRPPASLPPPSHPPPRLVPSSPPSESTMIMTPLAPPLPPPPSLHAHAPQQPQQPHTQSMQPMPVPPVPAPASTYRRPTLPDDLPTGRPKRGPLLVGFLALVALGGAAAAFFLVPRRPPAPSHPVATASPTPTPTPSPSPTPSPTPTPTPTPSPTPSPSPSPSLSSSSPHEDPDASLTTGTFRSKAFGHRVYIDGRLAGESGRDMTVACGPHKVKVGSAGTERAVVIPCGGRLDVD